MSGRFIVSGAGGGSESIDFDDLRNLVLVHTLSYNCAVTRMTRVVSDWKQRIKSSPNAEVHLLAYLEGQPKGQDI